MNLDHFGMDTITLAGPLEEKLRAVREAGFTQIMLNATDIVGHTGGESAAVAAVRSSGLRVTGFQVLRDFEGLEGHLHAYKVDVAKAMLDMCRALGSRVLLICSSASPHATGDSDALVRDLRKLAMLAVPLDIRIAYEALSWGRHVNLLVQLSDFLWQDVPSPQDRIETARHARVFPGEGVHSENVIELVRALDEMGYRGDYSFEVFNDDYKQLPLPVVAQRARASVKWITGRVARRSLPRSFAPRRQA